MPEENILVHGRDLKDKDNYVLFIGDQRLNNDFVRVLNGNRISIWISNDIGSGFLRIEDTRGKILFRSDVVLQRKRDCLGDVGLMISGISCQVAHELSYDPAHFGPREYDSSWKAIDVNFEAKPVDPETPGYSARKVIVGDKIIYRVKIASQIGNTRVEGPHTTYEMHVHYNSGSNTPHLIEYFHTYSYSFRSNATSGSKRFTEHLLIDVAGITDDVIEINGADAIRAALTCNYSEFETDVAFTIRAATSETTTIPGSMRINDDARIRIQLRRP